MMDAYPPGHEPALTLRRSGWVTASGIILLVVAAVSILMAMALLILGLFIGPAFTEIADVGSDAGEVTAAMGGIVTGVMVALGVVAVMWAGAHTAAGIGILAGRGWARIIGIVLAVIGLLVSLLFLAGTVGTASDVETIMRDPAFADMYAGMTAEQVAFESLLFGLLVSVPFIVGYLVVLLTMIRSSAFFDPARRTANFRGSTPGG